jgi:hypothetical protein
VIYKLHWQNRAKQVGLKEKTYFVFLKTANVERFSPVWKDTSTRMKYLAFEKKNLAPSGIYTIAKSSLSQGCLKILKTFCVF